MVAMKSLLAITSILWLTQFHCQDVGDPCPGGRPGVCVVITNCSSALQNIKLRKPLYHCSFKGKLSIVCCNEPQLMDMLRTPKVMTSLKDKKVTNTTKTRQAATNLAIPRDCTPISSNLTAPKIGQKAFDKCLYYQEKYIYPCVSSPIPGQPKTRVNFCPWSSEGLILNGENATRGEFPHMALLGFGTSKVTWQCGGTIISEKFVLTAAHCTWSPSGGAVTKVKIGILKLSEPDTNLNLYNVFKVYVHKDYKSPSKYNDIALLETDREMVLNMLAFPACLHDGSDVNDTIIITGWGKTSLVRGHVSDILQKAFLQVFDRTYCRRYHEHFKVRHLTNGVDFESQICFGSKNSTSDTCQGDSGGPAQIRHPQVYCMYLVIGVTSFGKSCGRINGPGVYTRVSHYLSWIESIVWP